jgi:hypothetical protein
VSPTRLATDVAIAAGLVAFVLIVSPGVAVSGIVAVLIVVMCAISSGLTRRGRARQRR